MADKLTLPAIPIYAVSLCGGPLCSVAHSINVNQSSRFTLFSSNQFEYNSGENWMIEAYNPLRFRI